MTESATANIIFVQAKVRLGREPAQCYRMYARIGAGFLGLDRHVEGDGWAPTISGPHIHVLLPAFLAIDGIRRGKARYEFSGPKVGWLYQLTGYQGMDGNGGHLATKVVIEVVRSPAEISFVIDADLQPNTCKFGSFPIYDRLSAAFSVPFDRRSDIFSDLRDMTRDAFGDMLTGVGSSPFYF